MTDRAEPILATLRAHRDELRRVGVLRLSLFGSVARGNDTGESDIDLAAEFDSEAKISLFDLVGIEARLTEILGRRVHLLPDPKEPTRLRGRIDRDARHVF